MYDLYIVRRTQIYIDERQGERLAEIAERDGLTMSALIRGAIDAYLDQSRTAAVRMERFRTAVAEAAGTVPELPPGAEYVDAIRPDYSERARELWGEPR